MEGGVATEGPVETFPVGPELNVHGRHILPDKQALPDLFFQMSCNRVMSTRLRETLRDRIAWEAYGDL